MAFGEPNTGGGHRGGYDSFAHGPGSLKDVPGTLSNLTKTGAIAVTVGMVAHLGGLTDGLVDHLRSPENGGSTMSLPESVTGKYPDLLDDRLVGKNGDHQIFVCDPQSDGSINFGSPDDTDDAYVGLRAQFVSVSEEDCTIYNIRENGDLENVTFPLIDGELSTPSPE